MTKADSSTRTRALVRLLPLVLAAALAAPSPAHSVTLAVSPAVVPAGSAFGASGTGFGLRGQASARVARAPSTSVRADRRGAFSVTLTAPPRAGRHNVRARAPGRRVADAPLSVVARAAPALSGSVGWSDGRRLTIYTVSATRLRIVGSGFSGRNRRISIRTPGSRAATLRERSRGRVSGSVAPARATWHRADARRCLPPLAGAPATARPGIGIVARRRTPRGRPAVGRR